MERVGIEPELHFQYYLKHLGCEDGDGGRGGVGSVKWKERGGSVFTIGQCMPLAISLEACLKSLQGKLNPEESDRVCSYVQIDRGKKTQMIKVGVFSRRY